MTQVVIVGDKIAERFGRTLQYVADRDAAIVFSRALNHGGNKARTQVWRSLAAQTGIKYGNIKKVVRTIPATPARLAYTLEASGEETNIGLFGAKQGKRGVSAAPWGKRRVFKKTFIVPAYGGKVYKRQGQARGPLDPLWGPNIGRELVKSPTVDKWQLAQQFVAQRVGHELKRLFAR